MTELQIGKWRTTGWRATAIVIAVMVGWAFVPTGIAAVVLTLMK
jgi:hypothetical protein